MNGNIIGDPIKKIIGEQIELRQKIQGAGYNENSISRSPEVLNFLNNRNAWIKFASGVSVTDDQRLKDLQKLESEGYLTENDIASLQNENLAKNYILFNTMQSLTKGAGQTTEGGVTTQTRAATYTKRSGVRNTNTWAGSKDKMYGGIGGSSRGLQPSPGITGITVESVNNGSIRKATVTLKAYNKFQFGIIEILYLRLGMTMMLEFGWDKYIDSIDVNNKPEIKNVESTIIENQWFKSSGTTQLEMLNKITAYSDYYKGNYQGFFGKVNNFSWKLNQDNTYDITVNLITLGSVIESLTCVVPADKVTIKDEETRKAKLQDLYGIKVITSSEEADGEEQESNSVITNLGSDRISQFIARQIATFSTQELEKNKDYYYLPNAVGQRTTGASAININRDKVPPNSRYYIRMGEFLRYLEDNIILRVVNGTTDEPKLQLIQSTKFTRINYIPNLVPLDPYVCIFKPSFNSEGGLTESIFLPSFFGLEDYVVEKDNVYYGELMNVYLNLDFISTVLSTNKNSDGELDIYTFFSKILEGVNKCMGNITDLTVKIKDDVFVYFLDENPIPGYAKAYPPITKPPIFNILGYDSKGGSNFVTSFDFQTKITPKLITQISIGATNPSSDTNSVTALGYNSWNRGLKNRFEERTKSSPQDQSYETKKTEQSISAENKKNFEDKVYLRFQKESTFYVFIGGYGWNYNGNYRYYSTENTSFWNKNATNFADEGLRDIVLRSVDRINNRQTSQGDNQYKESDKINDYPTYLLDAFGGIGTKIVSIAKVETIKYNNAKNPYLKKSNSIDYEANPNAEGYYFNTFVKQEVAIDNALYWSTSDSQDFLDRGQSNFKAYKSSLDKNNYEAKGIISGGVGFIPVTLSLTCNGIGGVKIFNSLVVNQKSLPASYPRALTFIINGVNHEVKGNKWETTLTTISQPRNDEVSTSTLVKVKNNSSTTNPDPIVVKGPLPPLNDSTFKIIDKRTTAGVIANTGTYGKNQTVEWLVGEMNENVQDVWRTFLQKLKKEYPGYTLRINATYRTYARSIQLQYRYGEENATPGRSPHNYAYGCDMNIVDPNGKVYIKSDRKPWVESGIPKIAENLNMRWGGSFESYVDCVHFDATPVTAISLSNAEKENKGLPQSEWVTDNIDYK